MSKSKKWTFCIQKCFTVLHYLFDAPWSKKYWKVQFLTLMNLHIPFPIMTSTFPFPCYYLCLLCPLSFQLVIFPVLHDLHRFPIFFHIYLIIHTLFVFLRQILSHSKYLSFTQPNQIAFLIPWPNPDNNSKSTPLFSLTEGVVHT